MKNLIIILVVCFFSHQLSAQTIISGTITDSLTSNPIAIANVYLFRSADKNFITSAFTNDSGFFSIELKSIPDSCYLEIEAIGFEKKTIMLKNTNPISVSLTPDTSNVLDEVIITARKKAISIKGDKIIYDVGQLGIGAANNGLETMQQLPGITLDKDEHIEFRGSAGIQIMINGKKSMLPADALTEYLRSLNGDDIQSVEIISQPSARYEATGTTGILNIVLKKNTSKAWGGSVYTNGSYGEYFKNKTGGRFFFNDDQWSINASGAYNNGNSFNDRSVSQTILLENGIRNLYQTNYWQPKTESKSFNLGIERKLSKNHLISTEWQWYDENETAETNGKTLDYLNGELQNEVTLTQQNNTPVDQISGNIFYNYTSDSLSTKIDAQINYGYYKKSINGFQQNQYPDGTVDKLEGLNQTKYNLANVQLDWSQKLSQKLKMELGGKYSYADMNYFNSYDAVQGNNFIIPDSLMLNDFRYKEKLTSLYTQMDYKLEKWIFMVGLRMENYHYQAHSKVNNQTNENSYTNWFPSASASYKSGKNQYRLSYSKRISRPDYLSLNPYFKYLDAYSIEKGNPYLKPQIFHSFELNYIYKNAFSFSLYGYLYNDGFLKVIDYQENENYNIIYSSNASKGSRFGLSASVPYEVGKWWAMQFSLDGYLTSEESNIENYAYDGSGYGYVFNMYHRFNLPQSWVITWNGFLSGRSKTPTGYIPTVYDFSMSVKKSFMDERLQLIAGCTNILKKSMWNRFSTVENTSTHWINKWETRKFYLQLTYRFGGNKEKKVKTTTLDEEENRM